MLQHPPLPTPDELIPGQTIGDIVGAGTPQGGTVLRDIGSSEQGVNATGWVAVRPLADLHAHLDKAYTWEMAGRPEGSLEDAIACWVTFAEALTEADIARNARRQVVAAARSGVTAIRSHVNYHLGGDPLRGIRAVAGLREEFRGIVDIQVVAMHSQDHPDGLIRDAVAAGADLLGGAPHLTEEPLVQLRRTLALAEEVGVGVDVHTDETLNPHSLGLLDLADATRDWPETMTRSAGHCVSLAMQEPDTLARVLDAVAEARVGIVTNPLTNLYLQGWEHPTATPRAVPPLQPILDRGIVLAAGGDNVQDPFNPLGSGDMVEIAASLVLAGHLTPSAAWDVATEGGQRMFGAAEGAERTGDVLLVRAETVAEAIAERAPDRVVIRSGRVTAVRRTSSDVLDPAAADDVAAPAELTHQSA